MGEGPTSPGGSCGIIKQTYEEEKRIKQTQTGTKEVLGRRRTRPIKTRKKSVSQILPV